jgi:hypothetical protein
LFSVVFFSSTAGSSAGLLGSSGSSPCAWRTREKVPKGSTRICTVGAPVSCVLPGTHAYLPAPAIHHPLGSPCTCGEAVLYVLYCTVCLSCTPAAASASGSDPRLSGPSSWCQQTPIAARLVSSPLQETHWTVWDTMIFYVCKRTVLEDEKIASPCPACNFYAKKSISLVHVEHQGASAR